jgi:hypothetical protein
MSEARDILAKVYEAFNARDIETVLAFMHPDVDWPNVWEGGRVNGHERVRDYWTRQWKSINPHVQPVGFDTDASGRVVVRVHSVVRDLDGKIVFNGEVQHVYQIVDGLIKSMEIVKP